MQISALGTGYAESATSDETSPPVTTPGNSVPVGMARRTTAAGGTPPSPIQLVEASTESGELASTAGVAYAGDTARINVLRLAEQTQPAPVAVGRLTLTTEPRHPRWGHQVAPILARLLHAADRGAVVVHVTATNRGDGATTVARLMAATAARLPWCRTLLLDAHEEAETRLASPAGPLPGLLEAFASRNTIEVAVAEVGNAQFHAAAMPPAPYWAARAEIKGLRQLLLPAYNLIVVDCPPVLEAPYFPPLAEKPAQAVLVVRARRTRISQARRAKDEIEGVGGQLFGVVMTEERSPIPRILRRFL